MTPLSEQIDDLLRHVSTTLELIAKARSGLEREPQNPKWRATSRRKAAVVFAALLAPAFERAFPDTPTTYSKGPDEPGSWAKFFVEVAHVALGWRPADLEGVLEEGRIFRIEHE